MLSDPLKYTDQKSYLKEIYEDKHVGSGYEFAHSNPLPRNKKKDNTKNAWYMLPKPDYDIKASSKDKAAYELCGFAQPFMGKHLD